MPLKGVSRGLCKYPVRHYFLVFRSSLFVTSTFVMDPGGTPGINTGILETVRYATETSPLQTHPNTEVMKISTPDSELSPVVTSVSAVGNPHVQDLSVSDDQQVEGLGQSYERRVHETPQNTREFC